MTTMIDPKTVVPRPTTVEAAALAEAARYFRRTGQHTAALVQLAERDPGSPAFLQLSQVSQSLLASAALCDEMRQHAGVSEHPVPSLPGPASEPA